MKRLYVAAALLLITLILGFWSGNKIKSAVSEMETALESAKASCMEGDYLEAKTHVREFGEALENSEGLMLAFVRRDYYYALRDTASVLMDYTTEETRLDMLSELARTEERLDIIVHSWFVPV